MESIRCACGRKLAEGDFLGEVSIKCPRCRAVNHIQRAARPTIPERPGASSSSEIASTWPTPIATGAP